MGYKDDSDTVIMITRARCVSGPALGAGEAETAVMVMTKMTMRATW